jgi:hypothetical protein
MIDIIAEPSMAHHVAHADALATGLTRHGLPNRTIAPWDAVKSDICACWGWRIADPLAAAGKRVLVMEHGYIGDRHAWTSFGWNGLNGRAEFAPAKDSDRFRKYFDDLLRPWNPEGDYALLIGQVEGDASLYRMDFQSWATRMAAKMWKVFGLPVRYRPHPIAVEYGQKQTVPGCETLRGTLAQALEGAAVAVTFNSNAGVDAMLEGKPVVAIDRGAMVYPIAAHDFEIQSEPARQAWADELAWCQFDMEEIRSGAAWEHAGQVVRGS